MRKSLSFFLLFLVATPVFAEVSDKIILPHGMLVYAVVLSGISIFANRKWFKFTPITAAVTCLLSSGGLAVILDPHIGPAAIKEQGQSYLYFAYLEFGVVLIANVFGAYLGHGLRKEQNA